MYMYVCRYNNLVPFSTVLYMCTYIQINETGIHSMISQTQTLFHVSACYIIQVTQLSCNDVNLAPDGCTEWIFGPDMGIITTYNFNDGAGHQLANQNQNICIR